MYIKNEPFVVDISVYTGKEIFFLKFLLGTCPFLGPLIPLFRTSGDISSGFQSQSGQPYSNFAEAYMIYIP